MEYTPMSNRTKKINNTKSRIDKFEDALKSSVDFINNHKQVSNEEKQLIELSFETMLDFLNKKSKEL